MHYQTNTDKFQFEQAIGTIGQALVGLSRTGRLDSYLALFRWQTAAARRKRVRDEWLRFSICMVFPLSPWPLGHGECVLLNRPDVTSWLRRR